MAAEQADASVLRLAEGFNALMDEYNHLLARSQSLEQSLVEVKSQVRRITPQPPFPDDTTLALDL